jgi:tetratricopeptide (TPR) repeat protein
MAMSSTADGFAFGERIAATSRDARSWMATRGHGAAQRAVIVWRPLKASAMVAFVFLVAAGLVTAVMWHPVAAPLAQRLAEWREDLLLLLQVIALLMASAVLIALIWWLLHAEAGVVGPFSDATGGRLPAVCDLLVGHLDRIAAVQRRSIADIPGERLRTERVAANPETVDGSLANVGTVNVGGQMSISIGQLLISLKRLLPGGRATTITGSVQRYGAKTQIVATVRRRSGTDTVMVEATSRSLKQADEAVPGMVRELAYRIHFALAHERMKAGTWELLEAFTEARAAYIQYLGSSLPGDCDRALRLTRQAYALDCTYVRLFGLFYALGTAFFGSGDYERAILQFETALTIHPRQAQVFVQLARCRYAMGQHVEALQLLDQYGGRPPDGHPMARYLRGMILGAVGDRGEAIAELRRVAHRPRSLRSAALVTIAGLHSQDGAMEQCRAALDRVAACDFDGDCYSRACWLSVRSTLGDERDRERALDSLRTALRKRLIPLDYALRDPDLHHIRVHGAFPELGPMPAAAGGLPLGLVGSTA